MANEEVGGETGGETTAPPQLKVVRDPALDQSPEVPPAGEVVPLAPEAAVAELGLSAVVPSPTNPRKRFRDIDKLAANIREVGQLQPILVRWSSALGGYEIVYGERRYRAIKLNAEKHGGPKSIRATIRVLTDKDVDELHLLENLQRDDLTPLEEADGYGRLEGVHGMKRAEIAGRFGKTLSVIHTRLQLLKLGPEARQALENEEVLVSVAGEIARCPVLKTQAEILTALKAQGITTHEAALELIRRDFSFDLREAPFDPEDPFLGCDGPCSKCPFNSTNQPQLELGGPKAGIRADVCTNPSGYREKRAEHLKAAKEKAEKDGKEWLSAEEAKKVFQGGSEVAAGSPYVPLKGVCYEDPKKRTWEQLVGGKPLKVYLAANARGKVVEVLDRAEALTAARGAGKMGKAAVELAARNQGEELKQRQESDEIESQVADRILSAGVVAMEEGKEAIHLLRMAVAVMLNGLVDREGLERRRGRSVEQLLKELAKTPEPKLRGLVFEMALMEHAQYVSDEMKALIRMLKLDRKALEREVKTAQQAEKDKAQKEKAEALFAKKEAAKTKPAKGAKSAPAKKKGAA